MKITIELNDKQIDKLKYIMKYCGDIWEHDIFFQSEEMHDLAKLINEAIDKMEITLKLNYKQAEDLKDIMQTTYDCGSHDFPYQSEKMRGLSDMICEAIDNAHTKDINDTHS